MRGRLLLVALAAGALAATGNASASAQIIELPTTSTTTAPETTTTTGSETTTTEAAAAQSSGSDLGLSVPTTAALPTVGAGAGPVVGQLGQISVTESGGLVPRAWTVTVSSTAFATTAGPSTIPASLVAYASGPATSVSLGAVALPGQPDANVPLPLTTSIVAFQGVGSTLETTVSWDPTIVVTLPPDLVAGTYQGTITHSVA